MQRSTGLLALLVLCGSVRSQNFSLRGQARYEPLVNLPGAIALDYDFIVAVSNCQWAIEITNTTKLSTNPLSSLKPIPSGSKYPAEKLEKLTRAPASESPKRFRQFFDGTDLITTIYWPNTHYVTNAGGVESIDGTSQLERNPVPTADNASIPGVLWLAYASQCYLDHAANERLAPFWLSDREFRFRNFDTPAKVERQDETNGFPTSITFYFDVARWNEVSPSKAPSGTTPDKPIQWAAYSATDLTNALGLNFPTRFSFTVYEAFRELVAPGSKLPVYRISGSLQSISGLKDSALFNRACEGTMSVSDFRLSRDKPGWSRR